MLLRLLPALLLGLTGCPPPVGTGDDTDTDVDTDTDTDDGTDDLQITARFDGAVGAQWRAAAFRVRLADGGTSDFLETVGEISSTALSEVQVDLSIPEPDPVDFAPILGESDGVAWLVVAYDDDDRNERLGPNEPVEAISRTLLFYLADEVELPTGTLPAQTFVALRTSPGTPPEIVPVSEPFDLRALPMNPSISFSGSISLDLLGGISGLSSYLYTPSGEPIYDLAPYDQPFLTQSWAVNIGRPLDAARQIPFQDDLPIPIVIERPVAYDDLDGDDAFSDSDEVRAWSCRRGVPFAVTYLPEVLDPAQAHLAGLLGYERGWNLTVIDSDGPPSPLDQGADDLDFHVDMACGSGG